MKVLQGHKSDKSNDSLDPIRPIHHRKRFILLALVFISVIFVAGYFYLKPTEANSPGQETVAAVTIDDVPIDRIIYAFGVSFDSEADIFSREFIEESERESLRTLSNINEVPKNSFDNNLIGFQVSYGYATTVGETEIWGSDKGEKARLIFELDESFGSSDLVSAVINRNADKVAFTVVGKATKTVDLWVYDMSAKTSASVAKDVKTVPFGWSADSTKIFMSPDAANTSTDNFVPTILDVANGEQTPLFDSTSSSDFGAYNVSLDGKKSAYIKPTVDKVKGAGPPYKIFVRSLENGQLSEVKDIRTKEPPSSLVFDQQSQNLLWSEGAKLYRHNLETGSSEEIFSNEKDDISVVYAATGTQVVVGIKLPDNTYGVYLVETSKKSKSLVMETTDSTSALGFVINK